jgi:hypothetical protein
MECNLGQVCMLPSSGTGREEEVASISRAQQILPTDLCTFVYLMTSLSGSRPLKRNHLPEGLQLGPNHLSCKQVYRFPSRRSPADWFGAFPSSKGF